MLPGGPRNERQMQMMMRRLGMKTEEVPDVDEVIVRTKTQDHVFKSPEVTVLTVQGVRTYQVVGTPEIRPRGSGGSASSHAPSSLPPAPAGPPDEDVQLVMEQAQVSRSEAVEALLQSDGAPAEAIMKLMTRRR
ncbi:MAG: nascent polypeptide-associated complex protein [Thermoplasmata archaeon]|jgi:nascent polypeptide-associated complex subunit alpha|nr:nascent polypeptide-associated complex protein [Thermoplasmata archaeon]